MTASTTAQQSSLTNIQVFGDALLRTGDLDPLYIGLVKAKLPRDQLARYLIAYWCFYHVGAAAWLSERPSESFWGCMITAAENVMDSPLGGRWPRASERRHFRGNKCVKAVDWLHRASSTPESPVQLLETAETEKQVMSIVQGWPMFGPWIAFKAADMMERVWGAPIKFDPNIILLYDEPRAALDLIPQHHPEWKDTAPELLYQRLLTYFSPRPAPPGGRNCGPQEVETILCKWKSQMGGHYRVGKDIKEHREALVGWGQTADRLRDAYPQEVVA